MVLELITSIIFDKWFIINTIFFTIIYQTILSTWNFFPKQNVKFVRGLPILGSHYRALLGLETISTSFQNLYEKFPNDKIIGFYELLGKASYLVRDIDLVKNVAIKDFDHFANHSFAIEEKADPLMSKGMFTMEGQKWREMRSTISPAFTGSKMRLMFNLLDDVSLKFISHLKKDMKNGQAKKVETKRLFERLASDTIASCAFGVEMNSMENQNNEFFQAGQYVANKLPVKFFLFNLCPRVMNFLRIRFFDDKQTAFFRNMTKGNMEYRMKNNVKRNDMIDLLIEAQKGTLKHSDDDTKFTDAGFATAEESSIGKALSSKTQFSNDELTAQGMTFFLAGFLGMVMQLSFACYELAVNQDIQDKLYKECKDVQNNLQGNAITYEVLQKMKYLDNVVSEVLRRYTLAPMLDRLVTKPYSVTNTDGTKIQLNVGDSIWIPSQGFHMDPQFFPNPLKFDPERFNDENKSKQMATAYMPFGIGPRNCIGSRFALMQAKASLYQLMLNFHLDRCDQTEVPLTMKTGTGTVEPANGFWINMELRS